MLSQHPPHTPHFAFSIPSYYPRPNTDQSQFMHPNSYHSQSPPPLLSQPQRFPQTMLTNNPLPGPHSFYQNSNRALPNINTNIPGPRKPSLGHPQLGYAGPHNQSQPPIQAFPPPLRQLNNSFGNPPFTVGDLTTSISSIALTQESGIPRSHSLQGVVEHTYHSHFPGRPLPQRTVPTIPRSTSVLPPSIPPPPPPFPPSAPNSFPTITPNVHQTTNRPQQQKQQQICLPLPDILTLERAIPDIVAPSTAVASKLVWIKDALILVSREHNGFCTDASSSVVNPEPLAVPPLPAPVFLQSSGPAKLRDERLRELVEKTALPLLVALAPPSSVLAARKRNQNAKGKEKELVQDGFAKDGLEEVEESDVEEGEDPTGLALYLRACLTASGVFPNQIALSPRNAFREFEAAARKGCGKGWYRLGRDYEAFGDKAHARMCFERGAEGGAGGDVGCVFRIGVAQLFGELNFPSLESASDTNGGVNRCQEQMESAFRMLHRAATLAHSDFPYPTYTLAALILYAILPLSALTTLFPPTMLIVLQSTLVKMPTIPKELLGRVISINVNGFWEEQAETRVKMLERLLLGEAHSLLERGAYLRCPHASVVLGRAYEFGFSWEGDGIGKDVRGGEKWYDPVMSVRYYELASIDAGETLVGAEADLALSKWFLCGSGEGQGGIEKDELKARECAERGARKGLGKAMFAAGYCDEAGIGIPGGRRDLERAKEWYRKALDSGEEEAKGRLEALELESGPTIGTSVMNDNDMLFQGQSQEGSSNNSHPEFGRSMTMPMTTTRMNVGAVRDGNGYGHPDNRPRGGLSEPPSIVGFVDVDVPRVTDSPAPSLASLRQAQDSRRYISTGTLSIGYDPHQRTFSPQLQPSMTHPQREAHFPQQHPMRLRSSSPPPVPSFGPGPGVMGEPYSMQQDRRRWEQPQQNSLSFQTRQFQDQPRYRLTDPGASGINGNELEGTRSSSVPAPANRRRASEDNTNGIIPKQQHTPPTRYETFADMGIEGKRAGDKECRVM